MIPKNVRFQREMGISHREFLRLLPNAVAPRSFVVEGDAITVGDGPQTITIRLSPEGQRRIGLLRLPVTHVDFYFSGLDDAAIATFMERFELSYRRGGG